ncbi:hypothetical protein PISMIDRAFT_690883 [Pisolithus microcarpus 441]|uniref:Uncharacterized protein n=1 Tax=Pisolithus microcarpus 441 TaxID=765257 RepID=A0A0C9Y0D6_9AGAM|nr:hypothetical protein PISMIDRAFT_690883 [Pisolithus microcarpus 441]
MYYTLAFEPLGRTFAFEPDALSHCIGTIGRTFALESLDKRSHSSHSHANTAPISAC